VATLAAPLPLYVLPDYYSALLLSRAAHAFFADDV